MARDLLNDKGEEFELLPELSNNTTSKILNAYIKWKRENSEYQLAKAKLNNHYNPLFKPEQTPEEIREEFLKDAFGDISSGKLYTSAWLIYPDIEKKVNVSVEVKKRLYRIQFKKHIVELKQDIKKRGNKFHHDEILKTIIKNNKEGKYSGVVQNRCMAIVACNYLKKFKDFEEFRKEIEPEKNQEEQPKQ